MIRKVLLTLLVSLSIFTLRAQSVEEIKNNRETYLFGEGRGTTIRQADNYALTAIISQISVNVDSNVTLSETETGTNEELNSESSFESIIETYSSATLSNTEMIIIENEPDAHVFRYIRRSDVERIFDARKSKILDMIDEAKASLKNGNINDALRFYYWSHALVKSLRYPNELYFYDDQGKEQMVSVWIPKQINDIFDKLKIGVLRVDDGELVQLSIKYNDKAVSALDYTCFDGFGWSNIYTGKEGRGVIELRKSIEVKKVQVKIEYAFENEAVIDPEVKSVLEVVEASVYKKAYLNLSLAPEDFVQQEVVAAATLATSQTTNSAGELVEVAEEVVTETTETTEAAEAVAAVAEGEYAYPEFAEVDEVESYKSVIQDIISSVIANAAAPNADYFTEVGLKSYNNIISYGAAKVIDSSEPKFYQLGDKVFCRNILMNFSFKSNNRTFMENVVFEFNADQKISNVTFGLSNQAIDDVFGQESWPMQARVILVHFLEGYKTAYGLKQIEYIESVFAEDALIITGSYVREPTATEMATINNRYVKYTRQSKSEYVRNLKYVFAGNEYININFADNEIVKAGKGGEIYGIQIKQEYFSSSYGDSGYLFLMVDLNDTEKPVIHVRTWQPDKDPDFGTYGLAHF